MPRRDPSGARGLALLGAAATAGLLAALAGPTLVATSARASDCSVVSTGRVPLNDLGAGTYQGLQGGLYPGGSNVRPPTHDAAGLAIAQAIGPLDTLGGSDPDGRIVLISIGMSNATQEFSTFVPIATADPLKDAHVLVVDCAKGGQATQDIRTQGAAYWDTVATRLRGHGSSPAQAQIVWLKEARRGPTEGWPAATDSLRNDLGAIVRIIRRKLPNVRLLYLSSRIYAGYATTALNPEPYAYESGFAVKQLIEAQIDGVDSLRYDPALGEPQAPWMAWGPYLWADGLTPRSDGLIWRCEDLVTDGTHPSTSGRDKVAQMLLAFFRSDETTKPWYLSPGAAAVGAGNWPAARLSVAPNPARTSAEVSFAVPRGEPWSLEVLDLTGRRVRSLGGGTGTGGAQSARWDGADEHGRRVGAGVYAVRLRVGAGTLSRTVALVASGGR